MAFRKWILAAALTVYFLLFNWGSLRVHFALDDLSNIGHYYEYSPFQLVLSNFLPWRGDYRPMGGMFYIPIYHFAGLNPVPYQAVLLALLLGNVFLVYAFARALGASELASWLAALAAGYHGGIANLYYNASFVFDVLCCFFYLASFVFYLRIRNRGRLLGLSQTAVFLLLFLCALNSKEMAVSIPVMILLYEWIYYRPKDWRWSTLFAWVQGPARVALIAGALDLVDIYSKVAGAQAMAASDAYHPVFTLARLHAFQQTAMRDLFFSWSWTPGWSEILAMWVTLAAFAWWNRGRPILPFLFWFLMVVPVPIEFLIGRAQACLVLLMVGGAIFIAVVFGDAAEWTAAFFGRGFRIPRPKRWILAAVLVVPVLFVWVRDQVSLRGDIGKAPMTTLGFETWDLIGQLRASDFRPRPATLVVFTEDPFHSLDMYFLARLWLHDRSVVVHVPSEPPLPDSTMATADAVFAFRDRKLIRLK